MAVLDVMQLSDDDWTRIDALLQEVWTLDPDERAAFLDEACDGEPAIRQKVEALLAAEEQAPDFLDGDAASFAAPAYGGDGAGEPPAHVDRRIGAYRLVEEVGRGGMSRVFRAERADGAFEQEVAVKLLRVGLDAAEARQRFRLERQVLATLDHPNIAGLLDGGLTEDGVPYLVMEYVAGRSITEYCDDNRCSIDERLRMVETVAEALSYAHRNMVVHRDLKPSNILVTEDGQVKVLDFGIAKLLDAEAAGFTTPATRTGVRPMTPAYAAPEQVRGEAISAATDAYQLGVLAYELLTGRRPHRAGQRSPFEVEQAVLEDEPARPSTVVGTPQSDDAEADEHDPEHIGAVRGTTPEALSRRLAGDLDAILLKALRKDPEERYASPDAFRADLERYEDGKPVQARSITPVYRLRKFARRYRGAVLAGGAGLLLVVFFVGALLYQQSQTVQQRDRARTEAEKAEQVSGFLVDLFEASNPMEETDTLTARTLLRRGEQRIAALDDQPAVHAQLLSAMGRAHTGLGNYATADSLLRRAIALQRQQTTTRNPAIASGLIHRAKALEKKGEYAAAESLAHDALQMHRALYTSPHRKVAKSINDLALYKKEQGSYAAAESLAREALSMRRLVHDSPSREVAATMNNLGQLLTERGDYARAESLHTEVLARRKQLFGAEHPKTAQSLNNLAQAVERQGNWAEAESLYRQTLSINREVLGPRHPKVAVNLNNLAVTVEKQGRLEEAEALKRKSLRVRRERLGEDHPQVTLSMNNLAVLLRKKEKYEKAAVLFTRVLDRLEQNLGEVHPHVAFTTGNLGDTRLEQGHLSAADSLYRRARTLITTLFDEDHPHVATSLSDLARLREKQNRLADAIRFYRDALSIRRDALGAEHPKTGQSLTALADVHMDMGNLDRAESLYREAFTLYRDALSSEDWRTARLRSKLGACLAEQGRPAAAKEHLEAGLKRLRAQRGPDDNYTEAARQRLVDFDESRNKEDTILKNQGQ